MDMIFCPFSSLMEADDDRNRFVVTGIGKEGFIEPDFFQQALEKSARTRFKLFFYRQKSNQIKDAGI